ncbi:MAG: hypothetical protein ABIZ80_05335, partial [Bryobacteraceae bacterium]
MQFNSYSYLLLLMPVAAIFWSLPPSWRRYYVLAVSLAFYASWNLTYTVLPIALCGMTWWFGRAITTQPERGKALLAWGTGAVLLVLAFFKYRDFFVQNINATAG